MKSLLACVVAFSGIALATATASAQAPSAPAPATDVYHVHFTKAVPGQAAALGKALSVPDKTSPMPEHFVVLRHQEGDDSGQALQRCHDGLRADPGAFAPAEATWIVRRVAELQGWAQPDWLAAPEVDADRSARR